MTNCNQNSQENEYNTVCGREEKIVIFIKPQTDWNKAFTDLYVGLKSHNIDIVKVFPFHMQPKDVDDFYSSVSHKDFFEELKEYLTSDYMLGMFVEGCDASEKARLLIGETFVWGENTLRKKYGLNITRNSFHCSRKEDAEKEIQFISDRFINSLELNCCS